VGGLVVVVTYSLIYRVVSLYSHCMRGTSSQYIGSRVVSNGSKASDLGDKPPEDGKYLSNKYDIWISPIKSIIPYEVFPHLWTRNNFMTAHQPSPSVVNSWPTTVACRSHSASSFVHSPMMSGCDATRRTVCYMCAKTGRVRLVG